MSEGDETFHPIDEQYKRMAIWRKKDAILQMARWVGCVGRRDKQPMFNLRRDESEIFHEGIPMYCFEGIDGRNMGPKDEYGYGYAKDKNLEKFWSEETVYRRLTALAIADDRLKNPSEEDLARHRTSWEEAKRSPWLKYFEAMDKVD